MDEVNAQRDKEPKKGGKFEKLEEDVSELGRNLAKVRTQVELKVSTIKDEGGNIAAPEKELGEVCCVSRLPCRVLDRQLVASRQLREQAAASRGAHGIIHCREGQAEYPPDGIDECRGTPSDGADGFVVEQDWAARRRLHGSDCGREVWRRAGAIQGPDPDEGAGEGAEGARGAVEGRRTEGQRRCARPRGDERGC